MTLWPIRAALVALFVVIAMRGGERAIADPKQLLTATRATLERAGYRVQLVTVRTWGDRHIPGDTFLSARHPLCEGPLQIRQASIANANDPAKLAVRGITPIFAFGEWSGPTPLRVQLLAEAARLQLRYAISYGDTAPPDSKLLVIIDPSACLAIATPAWDTAF